MPASSERGIESWEFEAIGTHWNIQTPVLSEDVRATLRHVITERIDAYDKNYSRFRTDSLIHRMSEEAGTYQLPSDAKPLFDLYQDLYVATDGAVTPLIGQMLVDSGYDSAYSLLPKELHTPAAWDDILSYDYPTLTLSQPAVLDLGAAGKGYLVDLIVLILENHGIGTYVVDAGGDIRVRTTDSEPYRIGLEHPGDTEKVLGIVSLVNQSICGSAGNRRAWGRFHHIFNPKTRESVQEVTAVWVVADEARIADGVSTALFFTEPESLRERLAGKYLFEYVVLYPDYSFAKSENFPGELFINDVAL